MHRKITTQSRLRASIALRKVTSMKGSALNTQLMVESLTACIYR